MVLSLLSSLAHAADPGGEAGAAPTTPSSTCADGEPATAYVNGIFLSANRAWMARLDALPATVHLTEESYTTKVTVVVRPDGSVRRIEVTGPSGVRRLDAAARRAVRESSPFEPPPACLLADDGDAHVEDHAFVVQVGESRRSAKP